MRHCQSAHGFGSGSHREDGQVSVLVVVSVALFVLLFVGFGVDMTNLYFHRQTAQGAADAACQAGAMDMLVNDQGLTFGGFIAGAAFNCSSGGAQTPCKYAALNGYRSPGLTDGQESNLVAVTFPTSIAGVTTPPVALAGPWSFMQVDVTDRVKVYFASLVSGKQTRDVLARSRCGVITSNSPVPIVVLHPTLTDSFVVGGTPQIAIVGGPWRSIQVNSDNTAAAYIGGSATVDLSLAGPNFTGGNFGVFGGPVTAPSGFIDGATGRWMSPSAPIQDPLKTVPPPAVPAAPTVPPDPIGPSGCQNSKNPCTVAYHVNGCPDSTGCVEFGPGLYTATIRVQNATAIFDPGIYYIQVTGNNSALDLGANGLVRPSTATGDGSGGTLFYASGGTFSVGANSGKNNVDPFFTCTSTTSPTCTGTVAGLPATNPNVICPNGQPPNPALPPTITGNIFLAPCTTNGTYNTPPTPQGPNRGIVFFQSRSDTGSAGSGNFSGGGGLLIVGTLYFHDCPNSVTGPCAAPPTDYQDVLSLVGNSGSTTRIVGEIITDQLSLQGTSIIDMQLNPYVSFQLLKVALLQ